MNDRVGALERVDGLAVVGQVGDELLPFGQVRVAGQVDADHVVSVLEQVANDRAARLASATGDDHAAQGRTPAPRPGGQAVRTSIAVEPTERSYESASRRACGAGPAGYPHQPQVRRGLSKETETLPSGNIVTCATSCEVIELPSEPVTLRLLVAVQFAFCRLMFWLPQNVACPV